MLYKLHNVNNEIKPIPMLTLSQNEIMNNKQHSVFELNTLKQYHQKQLWQHLTNNKQDDMFELNKHNYSKVV